MKTKVYVFTTHVHKVQIGWLEHKLLSK